MAKKSGLGKGLNAILEDASSSIRNQNLEDPKGSISEIPTRWIEANPYQPREEFDEDALDELVESIKLHGVIQPITVRKVGHNKYQLISGERRTRASIKAGLEKVPVYIRTADDQSMLEMALIENIQREDLNAMEVAASYKRLMDECSLNQEAVADRVGKKRSTVANYLRLFKLPTEVQIALRANLIRMGHARALINVDKHEQKLLLLEDILERDLSVRQVEALVRDLLDNPNGTEAVDEEEHVEKKTSSDRSKPDYDNLLWEERLSQAARQHVKVKLKRNGTGEVVLPFKNEEELQRIASILGHS